MCDIRYLANKLELPALLKLEEEDLAGLLLLLYN